MSFAFLGPNQADVADGAWLSSPIEATLDKLGARFRPLCGWRVVDDFGDPAAESQACTESVGLLEASAMGKIELQGPQGAITELTERLCGTSPKLGHAVRARQCWWALLTPARALIIVPPAGTASCLALIDDAAGSMQLQVTELTTSLGSNALVGPLARPALARLTALDLRPESFSVASIAPGSVARTPGAVLSFADDAYLHLFGGAYAAYHWTASRDAVEHLGGRPVGWQALADKRQALVGDA